ncbi:MAG: 50S ribosomal protein L31e [Candidatus Woesearchaeota archaeon]
MAKKEDKPKQVLERTYNVPLRREFLKVANYQRAKKAMNALQAFLKRHMKSSDISIGRRLNMKIWERGITNPPHHVKVTAIKFDDGTVKAELVGFPIDEKKKEKRKAKKEKAEPKTADSKPETAEAKTEPKSEEKPKKSEQKAQQRKPQEKAVVEPKNDENVVQPQKDATKLKKAKVKE